MNVRNIDLNLLYVFTVVYECESITLAADRLNLSQPAVSNALSRLKQSLNQVLFVKQNRSIVATRIADDLYKGVKSSLFQIEKSIIQLEGFDEKKSHRTFNIATCSCGDLILFPLMVPYLKQHAPNIKVVRTPFSDNDLNQQVLTGHLDLLLFFDFSVDSQVVKETLFSDPMVLVTGPKHSDVKKERLSIRDLAQLDLVAHGAGFEQYVPLLAELNKESHFSHSQINIENIWSVLNIVVTTQYAAVIPHFFAKKAAKLMPLNIHHLEDHLGFMDVCLYWRTIDEDDLGHQWLRNTVRNIILSKEEEEENTSSPF